MLIAAGDAPDFNPNDARRSINPLRIASTSACPNDERLLISSTAGLAPEADAIFVANCCSMVSQSPGHAMPGQPRIKNNIMEFAARRHLDRMVSMEWMREL